MKVIPFNQFKLGMEESLNRLKKSISKISFHKSRQKAARLECGYSCRIFDFFKMQAPRLLFFQQNLCSIRNKVQFYVSLFGKRPEIYYNYSQLSC